MGRGGAAGAAGNRAGLRPWRRPARFPKRLLVPATPDADLGRGGRGGQRDAAGLCPRRDLARGRAFHAAERPPDRQRPAAPRARSPATYLAATPDFFTALEDADTCASGCAFLAVPQVQAGLAGTISREAYIAYLTQAYHHVRHTVPLMQAARAALARSARTGRGARRIYRRGNRARGMDPARYRRGRRRRRGGARAARPHPATQAMVDHAYAPHPRTAIRWPSSAWSMCSRASAWRWRQRGAGAVAERLGLPPRGLHLSHLARRARPVAHAFFAKLVNGFERAEDRAAVRRMAREMFALFGAMFASIELEPCRCLRLKESASPSPAPPAASARPVARLLREARARW